MSGNLKQEYLDKKYADYDDESDAPYRKRKHVKRSTKKSDHRHEYENVVVVVPDRREPFRLISRCSICGKTNNPVKDVRIAKKFPKVLYSGLYMGHRIDGEDEYEQFKSWCKENYPIYEIEGFNLWDYKYI